MKEIAEMFVGTFALGMIGLFLLGLLYSYSIEACEQPIEPTEPITIDLPFGWKLEQQL